MSRIHTCTVAKSSAAKGVGNDTKVVGNRRHSVRVKSLIMTMLFLLGLSTISNPSVNNNS